MPSVNNNIIIPLLPDQEFSIKPKRKNNYGRFQPIGELTNMYDSKLTPKKTGLFSLLAQVTKGEYLTFNYLKDNRDPENNYCHISNKNLSKSSQVMQNRRLLKLKKLGIIKKLRKNTYILNPTLIMCMEQDRANLKWEQLP